MAWQIRAVIDVFHSSAIAEQQNEASDNQKRSKRKEAHLWTAPIQNTIQVKAGAVVVVKAARQPLNPQVLLQNQLLQYT